VINAVMDAIGGIRVSLGAHKVLYYALQGLFHPARKVRETYWRIYNGLYIGAQVSCVRELVCSFCSSSNLFSLRIRP
jgi:splicing factor 3B subunit 1